ncbi:hypothetical protein K491DRAFT_718766 [Lophiostoma macrostomum CBS 122681]|uniref:Uncharacterized protein n=1 Tax=Lophiostoma macrostomum CBS 122681 TaxID=1314788 RepID=A0A6A6SY26_9PLEO|nr:hypothetical protein K491DRAFT_718766 [Lophiostoma macrostomum CBS 122681]
MATASSSNFGFLSLPTELCFHIYALIAAKAPFTEYIKEYDGLRLASRQVNEEFEGECSRIFARYLADLSRRHESLSPRSSAQVPSSQAVQGPSMSLPPGSLPFRALRHLTLHLSLHCWDNNTNFFTKHIFNAWKPIAELRLETITIHLGIGLHDKAQALKLWGRFLIGFGSIDAQSHLHPLVVLETQDRWWWDNVRGQYPYGTSHWYKVAWVRHT